MPGPPPNRSNDHSRERDAERRAVGITKAESIPCEIPEANPEWGKSPRMIWDAVLVSGQNVFYQASDWAVLWVLMEQLDIAMIDAREKGKLPAMLLQTVYSQLSSLGLTEGERRRMRIELETEIADEGAAEAEFIAEMKSMLRVV